MAIRITSVLSDLTRRSRGKDHFPMKTSSTFPLSEQPHLRRPHAREIEMRNMRSTRRTKTAVAIFLVALVASVMGFAGPAEGASSASTGRCSRAYAQMGAGYFYASTSALSASQSVYGLKCSSVSVNILDGGSGDNKYKHSSYGYWSNSPWGSLCNLQSKAGKTGTDYVNVYWYTSSFDRPCSFHRAVVPTATASGDWLYQWYHPGMS